MGAQFTNWSNIHSLFVNFQISYRTDNVEDGEIAESPVNDEKNELFQSSEEAVHNISRSAGSTDSTSVNSIINNHANDRNAAGFGSNYDLTRRPPPHVSSSEYPRSAGKGFETNELTYQHAFANLNFYQVKAICQTAPLITMAVFVNPTTPHTCPPLHASHHITPPALATLL